MILAGFLPDYYPLENYAGLFRSAFNIGILCFVIAYFLYAIQCWGAGSKAGAVLMISVPLIVNSLATSKIPDTTTNIPFYLGILFCIFAAVSAIVLYVSDTVKNGLEKSLFPKKLTGTGPSDLRQHTDLSACSLFRLSS